MVLEFGLLKSDLFPSSEAAGEGFNPDTQAALLNEIGQVARVLFTDSTATSRSNSTVELTVATYTIPAGTVTNGIIVNANGSGKGFNAGGNSKLRIYIGATGSETERCWQSIGASNHGLHCLHAMETCESEDWSADVTVYITIQNNVSSGSDITYYKCCSIVGY